MDKQRRLILRHIAGLGFIAATGGLASIRSALKALELHKPVIPGVQGILEEEQFKIIEFSSPLAVSRRETESSGIFLVGIGTFGQEIVRTLSCRQQSIREVRVPRNLGAVRAFIEEKISQTGFIFAAGALRNRKFQTLRGTLSNWRRKGLSFVSICRAQEGRGPFACRPFPNECLVRLPENGTATTAAQSIGDIFGVGLVPGMIGLDYADIKTVLGGRVCQVLCMKASDIQQLREEISRIASTHEDFFFQTPGVFLAISSDYGMALSLKDICDLGDWVFHRLNHTAAILWGVQNGLRVPEGCRATLLLVETPGA